jgi:hypothetical protein
MKISRKNLKLTKKALFVYNQKPSAGQRNQTEDPVTIIMPLTSVIWPQ